MEQFSEKILKALGEWEIVKFLGAGQYGKVYEIQRKDFGTVYRAALKIISIPSSAEEVREIKSAGMSEAEISNYFEGIVEDFVREFALMAKLKGHTNIVGYEDHQVIPDDDGFGWTILIRMELLSSLTEYVTEKQMTRRDVIKMGIDLCKALELCQRVNIIHRDIKPANIFVSEMGEYKLGDFGVARIVENTMSGRTGTDTYMAPEVYYEEKYGPSADIYSLGIVMYRLLNSNRAPFLPLPPKPVTYRDNAEAFRRRINGEKLETPVQADGRLAEIVLKACAYRREDRYSSPETMRKELEAILYETDEAQVIYPNGDKVSAVDGLSTNATVALRDMRRGAELSQKYDDSKEEQAGQKEEETSKHVDMAQEEQEKMPEGETENSENAYHGDETKTDEIVIENTRNGNRKKNKLGILIGIAACVCGAVFTWAAVQGTNKDEEAKTEDRGTNSDAEINTESKETGSNVQEKKETEVEETVDEIGIQPELSGTVKVAAVETAYGAQMWEEVAAAFEALYPDVTVEMAVDADLDDVITPEMKAGNYPDVIFKSVGSESALTETFTVDKNLADLTDVLDMTVPGEHVKVGEKIIPGFIDNMITNPYGDGRTYLMPMFYSPCGLFYNANLLKTKGWDVPQTWDEMWALGDKAKTEGIALFTYPTAGYLDTFFYSLLHEAMDTDTFNSALNYGEGVWDTDAAAQVFDIIAKLAEYTHESTPSQANDNDYMLNQQLVLDNQAIFMPNGSWVIGEMEDAPRAEGFEWGFTAYPAIEKGGERTVYAFFEQIWMPSESEHQDLGKAFIAFLYSDTAADIFAQSGADQPIGSGSTVAVVDCFAAAYQSEVTLQETFFAPVSDLVTGTLTKEEWVEQIKKNNDIFAGRN